MPGADWIPIVSQIKSLVQLCAGDKDGFRKTTENFVQECPVVSQVTSAVQLIKGDANGALETQKKCLGTLNNVANGVPVVGHIKGGIHHLCGDEKGGDQAMKAANRSSVVLASGAVAGLASGGVLAVAAGITAGAAYDAASSKASDQPQGLYAAIDNAIKNPNAGNIVDAILCPVADGFAGYTGGELANSVVNQFSGNNVGGDLSSGSYPDAPSNPSAIRSLETLREVKLLEMDSAGTTGQALQIGHEINGLTSQIRNLQGKTGQPWVDLKAPHAAKINLKAPHAATITPKPIYASGCSETAHAKDVEANQNQIEDHSTFEHRSFETPKEQPEMFESALPIPQEDIKLKNTFFVGSMKSVHVTDRFQFTKCYRNPLPHLSIPTKESSSNSKLIKLSTILSVYSIEEILDILNPQEIELYNKDKDDGISSDNYPEYVGCKLSQADKLLTLNSYQNQTPTTDLIKVPCFKTFAHFTGKNINDLKRDLNDPKRNFIARREFFRNYDWLHVRMPRSPTREFNYTGAIRVNDVINGLLHTAVRHSNEWENFVPDFNSYFRRFQARFQSEISDIQNPNNDTEQTNQLLQQFAVTLANTLNNPSDDQLLIDLLDLQMDVYRFIENNITFANYIGEGTNEDDFQQVYFEVKDFQGNDYVMIVCVSKALYNPESSFGDPRNVRKINTIFFIKKKGL